MLGWSFSKAGQQRELLGHMTSMLGECLHTGGGGGEKKKEEQSVRSSRSGLMEALGRKQVWCCWKGTLSKGTRPEASILAGSEYLLVLGCAFFHHLPFLPPFMFRPLRVLVTGGALLWQPSDWVMQWSGPWIEVETTKSLTSGSQSLQLNVVAFNSGTELYE